MPQPPVPASCIRGKRSGEHVGGQQVLDCYDLVTKAQLAALQSRQGHLVADARDRQGLDRPIEVTMLCASRFKADTEGMFVHALA